MNNIKKALVCVATAGAATFVMATPEVSNVTMTQSDASRLVTITYRLTEDAVVTLDVMTNATPNAATGWASIGGEAICNAEGAVWRKVTSMDADGNGNYTIKWRPDQSWTDEFGKGFKIADGCAKAVVTAWALDSTPDYMVVDISAAAQPNTQRYYPAADFVPGGVVDGLYKTSTLLMRKIMAKGVTWTMGSTPMETYRTDVYEATHQVTLTNNYYIGVYEVTQAQWSLAATNSSVSANFSIDRSMRPMEDVSYNEIRNTHSTSSASDATVAAGTLAADPSNDSFLGLLRSKTGINFDLPSEAQWEFAARAGNGDMKWNDGSSILNTTTDANLNLLGRYERNGGKVQNGNNYNNPAASCGTTNGTAIVGSYAPNDWGIYDMHGNVWEWCLDWWQENIATAKDASGEFYGGRVNIDPSNLANCLSGESASSKYRVKRGGGWNSAAGGCRSANRTGSQASSRNIFNGFRVVCTAGLR